jgi:hypothetical protein
MDDMRKAFFELTHDNVKNEQGRRQRQRQIMGEGPLRGDIDGDGNDDSLGWVNMVGIYILPYK